MSQSKLEVKQELLDGIKSVCSELKGVVLISLSTSDGFNIKSFAAKSLKVEADKIAAMSSSVSALSNSLSTQILEDDFEATIIETKNGSFLFVQTEYLNTPSVLMLVAKPDVTLAAARYSARRFAKKIMEIEA